jgi:hypothetical protein
MTPREEELYRTNRELIEMVKEIKSYLTQRVLNMTEFNALLMKINKVLRDAGE